MKLKNKLFLSAFLIGLIPSLVVALIALNNSTTALSHSTFEHLVSLREAKKQSVTRYLERIEQLLLFLSHDPIVVGGVQDLSVAFSEYSEELNLLNEGENKNQRAKLNSFYQQQFLPRLEANAGAATVSAQELMSGFSENTVALQSRYIVENPNPLGEKDRLDTAGGSSSYDRLHKKLHPLMSEFLHRFSFYDIFIVDLNSGNVVYSVFKEVDFATSLKQGPYASSGLANAFAKGSQLDSREEVVFEDFSLYLPSYDAPAAFIAAPIFEQSRKVGVLIFQFPMADVNAIMSDRSGLGKTGETYLVGPDKLMRSDSYLDRRTAASSSHFATQIRGA